jgi:NitT/TauT family transport system ATP-binding protein
VVAEFTVPFAYPRPSEVRYEPEFARLSGEIAESLQVSS